MRSQFVMGMLCGLALAALVTFTTAIPKINDYWRTEIVKRGGGAWYFDKQGKTHWMWTAQPVGE